MKPIALTFVWSWPYSEASRTRNRKLWGCTEWLCRLTGWPTNSHRGKLQSGDRRPYTPHKITSYLWQIGLLCIFVSGFKIKTGLFLRGLREISIRLQLKPLDLCNLSDNLSHLWSFFFSDLNQLISFYQTMTADESVPLFFFFLLI